MSQTRFQLRPDGLIMVQATIYALDYSKHVTVDLILDTGASITTCTAYGFLGHSLKEDCAIITIYLKGVSNGETKNLHP